MIEKIKFYNSFILSFGIIYMILNLTVGQLQFLKSLYILKPILLKEILFLALSISSNFLIFDWKKNLKK